MACDVSPVAMFVIWRLFNCLLHSFFFSQSVTVKDVSNILCNHLPDQDIILRITGSFSVSIFHPWHLIPRDAQHTNCFLHGGPIMGHPKEKKEVWNIHWTSRTAVWVSMQSGSCFTNMGELARRWVSSLEHNQYLATHGFQRKFVLRILAVMNELYPPSIYGQPGQ